MNKNNEEILENLKAKKRKHVDCLNKLKKMENELKNCLNNLNAAESAFESGGYNDGGRALFYTTFGSLELDIQNVNPQISTLITKTVLKIAEIEKEISIAKNG